MAVERFDSPDTLGELTILSPRLSESTYSPELTLEGEISTKENILTIPEARDCIKDKFATYHKLLDDKESELLAELELLEETNKPELNHVRSDLVRLRGVVDLLDESLGTNTLKVFLDEQKSVWKNQILGFDRSIELLSNVTLNFHDIESSIRNVIKVVPFWSKAKFRTELQTVLEMEPQLGEDWYIVSEEWFSEFTTSINLTDPQQNDSWEFPVKIPIQTTCDANCTKLLHSKAWDMLLAFNGLSSGSIPIKRQSYQDETTNRIEVPIQATKHKCTIGHNDGDNKFSFECEIEAFPFETTENILKQLFRFSTLLTDYPPVIYTFDNTDTISYTLNSTQYRVRTNIQPPQVQRTGYGFTPGIGSPFALQPYSNLFIPDSNPFVSVIGKIFLVIIPDSRGNNRFQVVKQ